MSSLILMTISSVLLVEMMIKRVWKKSISTFILLVGFAIYFCCDIYQMKNLGSIILSALMFFAYYRAIFKSENEKIITWSQKDDKQ